MQALLDDVFDLLEGSLDELVRTRDHASSRDALDSALLASRVRETRAAVATLSALMRDGLAWRPAKDGHEAPAWRTIVLDVLATSPADVTYVALWTRELDELVALAGTSGSARRPIPKGACERLGRRAGVHRRHCMRELRDAGDDLRAGWASTTAARALVRIPYTLGVSLGELAARLCAALTGVAAPATRALLELGAADTTGTALATARDRVASWKLTCDRDAAAERAAFYALEQALAPNLLLLETSVVAATHAVGVDQIRAALAPQELR